MKVQVLGGHGGQSLGFQTTSFLIDDQLLIDAGSITSSLTVEEQAKLRHILISHSHLDHIKDLAFLCDNTFGMFATPIEVYSHETVNKIIKANIFNDDIWPDFSTIPSKEKPTIRFNALEEFKTVSILKYQITPIKVNHPNDAFGFIIDDGKASVLFTIDTAATDDIWTEAKKRSNLKAIFTEVSFPNKLEKVAQASFHHTPQSLELELKKMPQGIPVILTHLKPGFKEEIIQEIKTLNKEGLIVLENDGLVFNF